MNNNNLQILPVKKDKIQTSSKLNPILPARPFAMILVGPPRSGKSNALMSLIAGEQFYYCGNEHDKDNPSYFDEIYVFCPSARFDKTTKRIYNAMDNLIIIDDLDDLRNSNMIIQQIMKEQKEYDELKEGRPAKKILFLIDDMVGMLKETGVDILITKYRHYNISILLCSQAYRKIPLTVRNCATALIFFNLMNARETEKVYDEYGSSVPNFYEHIKVLDRKYQFMFYHIEDQKFYHNFERLLWSKDDYLTN
jgi:hypothetical protein